MAAAVQEAVFAENFFDQETRVQKYRETRLADYNNATKIESFVMAQLEAAQTDPSAGGATAAIKRLSLAAQALQRTSAMKQKAIGVVHDPEELPVIRFENLTEKDIEEIRRKNEGDDFDEEPECDDAPVSAGSHDDGTAGGEAANDDFEDDDDIIVYRVVRHRPVSSAFRADARESEFSREDRSPRQFADGRSPSVHFRRQKIHYEIVCCLDVC